MSRPCKCYALQYGGGPLEPFVIQRREPISTDVVVEIKYAGICHSDIHTGRLEWGDRPFPLVPGHEMGGVVTEIGSEVTKFKVGDVVGVGVFVDCCRTCTSCTRGMQQYCIEGPIWAYGAQARYPHCAEYNEEGGAVTQGGYSKSIVVHHDFVVHIPVNLDLAAATPLLCAGITSFSPLKEFNLRPTHKLAVVGLGGLGHMGVKFGKAFGAHVTVISRGNAKKDSALNSLGADAYLDSTDSAAMSKAAYSFDFILDTVSANHNLGALMETLTVDGTICVVGLPPDPYSLGVAPLIMARRRLVGSNIGSVADVQEMLLFCGRHNIVCDIELIDASAVNDAWDRTVASDVKYRFVIDTSTI